MPGLFFFGCSNVTAPVKPAVDIYKIKYPAKYEAALPNEHWSYIDNSRDLNVYAPQLIDIYMKKDSGSIILVRTGRRIDFGVPAEYELTKPEMIYLIKLIPNKGSFIGPEDYKNPDPLFEKIDKLYRYDIDDSKFGPGQILSTITSRGELLLVEFFAPQASLKADEPDFFKFLESLKERKVVQTPEVKK